MQQHESLTAFETDTVNEFLFHLPEMRAKVASLSVVGREHHADGFLTIFACQSPEPEWSMSLDSEIILTSGVLVDAELWSRGDDPWKLRVWNPRGSWDGDTSGYTFEGP